MCWLFFQALALLWIVLGRCWKVPCGGEQEHPVWFYFSLGNPEPLKPIYSVTLGSLYTGNAL